MYKILLDTSFIITLLDEQRDNHFVAKEYYKYFLENGFELYFSTLSICEYCIRGKIDELPIDDFTEILPFNIDDSIKSAELNFSEIREHSDSRDIVKEDLKIIAQAIESKCNYVITDDERTFFKYTQKIREKFNIDITPIAVKSKFDISHFNDGQKTLEF